MMPPAAVDAIVIMTPPTRLMGWLIKVFAAKRAKGEAIPPEFERWIERMERIRLGITTELSVLNEDEWKSIKNFLEDN